MPVADRWRGWNKAICQGLSHLVMPVMAIVAALSVGALLMLAIGISPAAAFAQLWAGAFASKYQIGVTLVKAIPLMLTALGLGFAFRSGVFNIGAEGQIYIGALCGTFIGIQDLGLPAWAHIPLSLCAGFIGGGIWGAIPGFLKARYRVNEVITTILMNYIAILVVSYFTHGPLKADRTSSASMPHTLEVQISSRLPLIWEGSRLHAGILAALIAVAVMAFITYRTAFGFKARAVGFSPSAARYAGMSVVPIITLSMLISGGLAGMAGTIEILGVQRRLRDQFLSGTGYTAIAIALFGRNDPLGIALAAILFGALEAGASNMEALAGVPSTLVEIIQAVIIFLVAVSVSLPPGTLSGWIRRLIPRRRASQPFSAGAPSPGDKYES